MIWNINNISYKLLYVKKENKYLIKNNIKKHHTNIKFTILLWLDDNGLQKQYFYYIL